MSSLHDSEFPEPNSMTVDPANLGSVDPLSVEGIFLVALSKSGAERDAFLGVQCADLSQRQRVEALLHAYEQAGNFLQKPAVAAEATPIRQYLDQCALPGTLGKLGPYEILEEIGRGGMGVVFRAHDPKLQRIVAVKALAPELARLPSARQRFLREARAAAAVSHPHVVTIFAVEGTEEASLGTERTTLPYLVMECVVGQTLHDKIKRVGALKVEEIIRISRQIAEGLTAAHKRGLIHRDIKPANILLENGVERVKITDFGLARTTSDGGITHTGEILGTPQCMSPEQARGEIVDQRSDLFSLGCVMYTMCTGVSPFRADNMLAVMKKVCEEAPRPIAQVNSNLPEWLCELVHQLLEKEPERRVQTAEQVVGTLESRVARSRVTSTEATSQTKVEPEKKMPQWLLTPVIPKWGKECRTGALEISVAALVLGMIHGSTRGGTIVESLTIGCVFWIIAALLRFLTGTCRWVTWKTVGISFVSLAIGRLTGIMLRHEAGQEVQGLLFVFGSAIAIFWLLTRWFPQLFIQNRSPQPDSSASTVAEFSAEQQSARAKVGPRSPWVILEWIIVGTLGIAVLSSLGFATVFIVSYLPPPGEISPHATCVIRTPVAENVKYVTIDGKQAILEPGGPGEWRTTTAPGTHGIYVAYDSDSFLNQERFFTTTVSAERGKATIITAEPIMARSLTREPGIDVPSPGHSETISADQASTGLPINRDAISTNVTASIPLADAVEILTEPASTLVASYAARDEVWIDEPGLIIRMRRESFEGLEDEQLEYCSNVTWGEGRFIRPKDTAEVTDLPAGRYQVLVQDLDYGWPLDRRGTITIGNELTVVHVKRSFQTQRLQSSGADRFPMSFRWAGKSYQIDTPDDVQIVNGLLAATAEKQNYVTPESFRTHPLFVEAVDVEINGGGHSLRHHRTLAQIDVQSSHMRAGFRSPLGVLAWNQKCVSPGGVFVPPQGLEMFVTDGLIGWGINGWDDNRQITIDESLAMPLVARRDRGSIRRLSDAPPENSSVNGGTAFQFRWFNEPSFIKPKSVPAVQRLVAAWADGQPDVPEAELLQLGEASSWEELWTERPEGSGAFSRPEFLVGGNVPGTWRMREPPEGAVSKQ